MLSGRAKGLLAGAVFLTIVGTLLNISQLFVMAAALIALCILSFFLARRAARGLTGDRRLPELVQVGQPFDVTVNVSAPGALDDLRFEAWFGIPEEVDTVDVEDRQTANPSVGSRLFRLSAIERGCHTLGELRVSVQDPLGLFYIHRVTEEPRDVLAWPKPLDPSAAVRASQRARTPGQRETGRRSPDGAGIHGVRQWAPGDTLRRVHWPSTARLGRLAVVEFETEAAKDVLVVLDVRARPKVGATDTAFEAACGVVSHLLHQAWDTASGVIFTAGRDTVETATGTSPNLQKREALALLARVRRDSPLGLSEVFRDGTARWKAAAGMWFITTDWDEDARSAIASFAGEAGSPAVIVVTDEDEANGPRTVETSSAFHDVYYVDAYALAHS